MQHGIERDYWRKQGYKDGYGGFVNQAKRLTADNQTAYREAHFQGEKDRTEGKKSRYCSQTK